MMRLSKVWASRRVRFQLTPLMDLLLIIVFAQFLDVREASRAQTDQLQSDREKLTRQIAVERSELQGIREAMRNQNQQWQRQRDEARAARDEAIEQTQRQASDMQAAMDMIASYFAIDDSPFSRTDEAIADDDNRDPVKLAVRRAAQLADSEPDAVIRFLIGHAELLKRAEIWTVHADATRKIRIQAGDSEATFRLEARSQTERTTEVGDRLFAAYKQFPQPKGLVVLLVSFDPQSVAGIYQPLVDSIPATLERLRSDTPGSRFEYTVLGPTADPYERLEAGDPEEPDGALESSQDLSP